MNNVVVSNIEMKQSPRRSEIGQKENGWVLFKSKAGKQKVLYSFFNVTPFSHRLLELRYGSDKAA